MNRMFAGLVVAACFACLSGRSSLADEYGPWFDRENLVWTKSDQTIKLTGRARISGAYDDRSHSGGALTLDIERQGHLKVKGKCRKVQIVRLNGECDLLELKIGIGGLRAGAINGGILQIGSCSGPIAISGCLGQTSVVVKDCKGDITIGELSATSELRIEKSAGRIVVRSCRGRPKIYAPKRATIVVGSGHAEIIRADGSASDNGER